MTALRVQSKLKLFFNFPITFVTTLFMSNYSVLIPAIEVKIKDVKHVTKSKTINDKIITMRKKEM